MTLFTTNHGEPLTLDIFGNIENWPNDFFGDRGAEILASLEARAKRTAQ